MKRSHIVTLVVCVAMLFAVGCSSSSGEDSDPLESPSQESPSQESPSQDVFPTEDEIGLLAVEEDLPRGFEFYGPRMVTEAEARAGLEEADPMTIWPPEADAGFDGIEPWATGEDAAGMLADFVYLRDDRSGCWVDAPPAIEERGASRWGGPGESVQLVLYRFGNDNDARTFMTALTFDPSVVASTDIAFIWAFGDETSSYTSERCLPVFDPLAEQCASIAACVRGPGGGEDSPVAAGQRGEWVALVNTSPGLDPETYLQTSLTKLPS